MTTEAKLTTLAHINTLWELLELALGDLEKCERDENVRVDMLEWCYYDSDDQVCCVCAAGSVIRNSLQNSGDDNIEPCDFDDDTEGRLMAINSLRQGKVADALNHLSPTNRRQFTHPLSRNVANYHIDRDQWWADMRQLLADLKASNI
jgi:hypothetical protein